MEKTKICQSFDKGAVQLMIRCKIDLAPVVGQYGLFLSVHNDLSILLSNVDLLFQSLFSLLNSTRIRTEAVS